MAVSRAERLMNLHILLLGARRFLDKEAIREACYADHPDTAVCARDLVTPALPQTMRWSS